MTQPKTSDSRDADAPRRARASSEEMFRRELAHSRRVRTLKIALPSLAALMVATFLAYSWVVPENLYFGIDGAALRDGKLVMAEPKLEGVNASDMPYTMTAKRAIQDISNSSVVELEDILADLPVDGTNRATIEAARGIYNRADNTLDVTSDMRVVSQSGLKALLRSADIDIASGNLTTDEPVRVEVEGTLVTADSMQITERGKVVVFDRRVRMVIDGSKVNTASNQTGASNEQN